MATRIRKFNINKSYTDSHGAWSHPLGVIFGARRTGKSTNIASLCYDIKDKFGSVYRFSPTADMVKSDKTKVFGNIFPRAFCFSSPKPGQLTRIREFQSFLVRVRPSVLMPHETNCLIILDDLSSDRNLAQGSELETFACNGRNIGITVFLAVQYYNQIPPSVRENCDFFMTNFCRSTVSRKKMFTEIFSIFDKQETFYSCLDSVTKEIGHSLVFANIEGVEDKSDITNCVFHYKSTYPLPDFTMDVRIPKIIDLALAKTDEQITKEIIENMAHAIDANERELEENNLNNNNLKIEDNNIVDEDKIDSEQDETQ